MVIQGDIFENNQITLFSCFTFIPEIGGSFYCVGYRLENTMSNRSAYGIFRSRSVRVSPSLMPLTSQSQSAVAKHLVSAGFAVVWYLGSLPCTSLLSV